MSTSEWRVIRPRHFNLQPRRPRSTLTTEKDLSTRAWAQRSVGGGLKEARDRRREDAPAGRRTCVPAKLPGVVLSAFEHRLNRTAYRRDTVPRAIDLVYQARYIGEVRHRDARSPEAVPRVRSTRRTNSGARVGVRCHQVVE
jgi:hypothetical protein